VHWAKFHFKTEAGIQNLTSEEAARVVSTDGDHATRDLFYHIQNGGEAAWKAYVQIMPEQDATRYRFNPFDVTKVWSQKDYPLIPYGRLVLNRNPVNYFGEVEQAAFSPSHMVPGIEPSPDKMLQGRLFSYPDTHRHRLGVNYQQIPINCPYAVKGGVHNNHRDGPATVNGNQGSEPNYHPNSFNGPVADAAARIAPFETNGVVGRYRYQHPNDDHEQAGALYRLMPADARTRLVNNISGHLGKARKDIQERAILNFYKADVEYGTRIAKNIGLDPTKVFAGAGKSKL